MNEELMLIELKDIISKYKNPFQNMTKNGRRLYRHLLRSLNNYDNEIILKNSYKKRI